MLRVKKNKNCSGCGDRVECRLCGIIKKELKGYAVVKCDKLNIEKNLKRAHEIAQMELFSKGGDLELNTISS